MAQYTMAQYPPQYASPDFQPNVYMQVPQAEDGGMRYPSPDMYMQVPQDAGLQQAQPEDLTEEFFDIPSDAYGAAILALVRDVPALCVGHRCLVALYNCLFGFGLLVLNIFMQFALLGYVDNFVVNFDVYHVQAQFGGFRSKVFSNGEFDSSLWDSDVYSQQEKQFLCAMGMTNTVFYYACIFCWTLTVMIEVRTNINFASDVWRIPRCYNAMDQILVQTVDGKHSESVVGLTGLCRLTIFLIIVVPKFIISSYLLWLGCNWLSAAKSFESLVMNCVAMAFIVETDEMLFNAVLPKSFREEVEALDFLIREPPKDDIYRQWEKIRGYNSSVLFLISACAFVYVYTFYLQEVLPIDVLNLEPICRMHLKHKYADICDTWGLRQNGKDPLEECYPARR